MTTIALPRTYTAHEVSEILRIPVRQVYRAAKDGQIPGRISIGARTRFAAEIIDRLAREAA